MRTRDSTKHFFFFFLKKKLQLYQSQIKLLQSSTTLIRHHLSGNPSVEMITSMMTCKTGYSCANFTHKISHQDKHIRSRGLVQAHHHRLSFGERKRQILLHQKKQKLSEGEDVGEGWHQYYHPGKGTDLVIAITLQLQKAKEAPSVMQQREQAETHREVTLRTCP